MSSKDTFRKIMAERRDWRWQRDGMDYAALTRAARKLYWLHRGVPTTEWTQ